MKELLPKENNSSSAQSRFLERLGCSWNLSRLIEIKNTGDSASGYRVMLADRRQQDGRFALSLSVCPVTSDIDPENSIQRVWKNSEPEVFRQAASFIQQDSFFAIETALRPLEKDSAKLVRNVTSPKRMRQMLANETPIDPELKTRVDGAISAISKYILLPGFEESPQVVQDGLRREIATMIVVSRKSGMVGQEELRNGSAYNNPYEGIKKKSVSREKQAVSPDKVSSLSKSVGIPGENSVPEEFLPSDPPVTAPIESKSPQQILEEKREEMALYPVEGITGLFHVVVSDTLREAVCVQLVEKDEKPYVVFSLLILPESGQSNRWIVGMNEKGKPKSSLRMKFLPFIIDKSRKTTDSIKQKITTAFDPRYYHELLDAVISFSKNGGSKYL